MSKKIRGIYQNCDPQDQPEDFYRDGQNIILDQDIGAILNEQGTIRRTILPSGSKVIGSYLLTNDTRIVFLDTNRIGIFTGGGYQPIFENEFLNFDADYPIQADLYIDKQGDRILTWVDGLNPARFLNIDDVNVSSNTSLNLFPSIDNVPQIEITNVNNTGGSLKTGTYYIAIAYKHQDESITNFYDVVGPVPIIRGDNNNEELFRGSADSLETSKSISMSFNNVDTEYESIQLAVIPVYNGVIDSVQLLPEIPITTEAYTYTGGESFSTGSLEEIQIDQAFYAKPKTIHINDDTIYLGNLQQQQDIGYQKYAKDIRVIATGKILENSIGENGELNNSFRNPVNTIYNKSFKRGEVYALYISWILKEGGESRAYHIPGRAPANGEENSPEVFRFRSEPTTTVFNATKMGYWENEDETYPNDSEIWGNLAGENVRHHHFPEIKDFPLYDQNQFTQNNIQVLGFRLTNIPLPENIKEQVTGYKIYYAKRTVENKRILDQSVNIESRVLNNFFRASFINDGDNKENGTVDRNVFHFHPFHSLRTRQSIGQITHLKAAAKCIDNTSTLNPTGPFEIEDTYLINIDSNAVIENDKLKTVEGISYIDSTIEDNNINLSAQGFNRNMNNRLGESKIIAKIDSPYDGLNYEYANSNGTAYYLTDLFSYKENVYNSFDNQILESTNYIHTDLESLDSNDIYGGDTFVNLYVYRVNKRYNVSGVNVSYANIINLLCESSDNISYRRVGENAWEGFYPHFTKSSLGALGWRDGVAYYFDSSSEVDVWTVDNYFFYNEDYSKTNDIRFPPLKEKEDKEPEKYPSRVIRSRESTSGLTRMFLPEDYIDLTTKRGELVKLTTYNNILIPHMERSLIRTKGREELQVGDIKAFLGSGDIFSTKPEELIYSEDGFGGIEKKEHSLSTPYGYAFYDKDAHKMFLINNEGLQDIGEPIKPILDNLFPTFIRLGYDPKYERLFITFDDQTWSYSFRIKGWISRHTFVPDWYIHTKGRMYTAAGNEMHEHNTGLRGRYYNVTNDSTYSYIDNKDPNISKVAMSLMINSIVRDISNNIDNTRTFDQFRITNSIQDTGIVDIEYFANEPLNPYIGNARKTLNKWFINQFRDITSIPDIPESLHWQYMKKLEDHYHRVDLIKDNSNYQKITLIDTDLIYKNSIR